MRKVSSYSKVSKPDQVWFSSDNSLDDVEFILQNSPNASTICMTIFLYSIQPAPHLEWNSFTTATVLMQIFLTQGIKGQQPENRILDPLDISLWGSSVSTNPLIQIMHSFPHDAALSIICHLIYMTSDRRSASGIELFRTRICLMALISFGLSSEEVKPRLILLNFKYRWNTHVPMFFTSDWPVINGNPDEAPSGLRLGLLYLLWLTSLGPFAFARIVHCRFFLIMERSQRLFTANFWFKEEDAPIDAIRMICHQMG